jgi:hypothetical protein
MLASTLAGLDFVLFPAMAATAADSPVLARSAGPFRWCC